MYHCGVYRAAYSIYHALECNKGSLITEQHKELHNGVVNLASKLFTPTHVREEPKNCKSCAVCEGKAKAKVKEAPPKYEEDLKVDSLIQYLWTQGTEIINNMRVVNTDAVSHQFKTPEKCLETAER